MTLQEQHEKASKTLWEVEDKIISLLHEAKVVFEDFVCDHYENCLSVYSTQEAEAPWLATINNMGFKMVYWHKDEINPDKYVVYEF